MWSFQSLNEGIAFSKEGKYNEAIGYFFVLTKFDLNYLFFCFINV